MQTVLAVVSLVLGIIIGKIIKNIFMGVLGIDTIFTSVKTLIILYMIPVVAVYIVLSRLFGLEV